MALALRKVTVFGIHAYAAGIYFDEKAVNDANNVQSLLNTQPPPPYIIRIGNDVLKLGNSGVFSGRPRYFFGTYT